MNQAKDESRQVKEFDVIRANRIEMFYEGEKRLEMEAREDGGSVAVFGGANRHKMIMETEEDSASVRIHNVAGMCILCINTYDLGTDSGKIIEPINEAEIRLADDRGNDLLVIGTESTVKGRQSYIEITDSQTGLKLKVDLIDFMSKTGYFNIAFDKWQKDNNENWKDSHSKQQVAAV